MNSLPELTLSVKLAIEVAATGASVAISKGSINLGMDQKIHLPPQGSSKGPGHLFQNPGKWEAPAPTAPGRLKEGGLCSLCCYWFKAAQHPSPHTQAPSCHHDRDNLATRGHEVAGKTMLVFLINDRAILTVFQ